MNLAVMVELPLVVIDVQRGGPSTGLPTKTEQADLLQVLWGRNSESPMPVIAASTPGDCFETVLEAVRLATRFMTPVVLLSDGYIANGSEPWKLPKIDDLAPIPVRFWTDPATFMPYRRDPVTLARPWARPGTPGLEHRVGGIEKQDVTGNVSYDPANHERMCQLRAEKVARIADDIPPAEVLGAQSGRLLVLSWGSTRGAIAGPVSRLKPGTPVGWCHLRYLNPLPRNLGDVIARFDRVLVPELNLGQLSKVISARFGIPVIQFNKVQGRPFMTSEIDNAIHDSLEA
jgi:2-oxoglutarate ferredoxin oxidoreductase subunit alpha